MAGIMEDLANFLRDSREGVEARRRQPSPVRQPPYIGQEELRGLLQINDIDTVDMEKIEEKGKEIRPEDRVRAEQIIQEQKFRDWLKSPKSGKLLIQGGFIGNMTCPLSIFCTTLAKTTRPWSSFLCLVWFCGRNTEYLEPDTESSDANCGRSWDPKLGQDKDDCYGYAYKQRIIKKMMRSLIAQLLRDYDFGPRNLLPPDVDPDSIKNCHSLSQLRRLFRWLVRQLPKEVTLFCLIDGIDTYEGDDFAKPMHLCLGDIIKLPIADDVSPMVKLNTALRSMATWKSAYAHRGIYISYSPEPQEFGDNEFAQDGFLLVGQFVRRGVYIVQSISNNKMYFVKSFTRREGAAGWQTQEHEFTHELPPEVRISTSDLATVQLLDESYFPKVEFIQFIDVDNLDVYFEYKNGGTLEQLREVYYRAGCRIPEHFIWHVTAELCNALAFMYLGQWRNLVRMPGWNRIFHRDINPSNVLLNFPPRRRGNAPRAGNRDNAFPEITLTDFGDSVISGDNPNDQKPGIFVFENNPDVWEDIYHVGRILRSLCMTHILFPEDDPDDPFNVITGGVLKDESRRWRDRPDSRRLAVVNEHPNGTAYSVELINLLSQFEWPNQEVVAINVSNHRSQVVDIGWVVDKLLPVAKQRVRDVREGVKPAGYYDAMDVSWAKPPMPMPYMVDGPNDPRIADVEDCIQRVPDDYEVCTLEYPMPKITLE
ncbi:kinase-like domain-containing protein [Hypoxylon cercidicola]|nr:kinase-like domain-containing protein [Hypoxylon cercidicola]